MVLPSTRSIVPLTRWVPGGCCCWARAAETVSAVARTATFKIRVLIMLLPPEGIMHHCEFRQASPSMARAYDNRVWGERPFLSGHYLEGSLAPAVWRLPLAAMSLPGTAAARALR